MSKERAAAIYTDAATRALCAWQIAADDLELVSVSENVTFRVDAGDVYVLRLHRPGYHDLDELISERVWIRALEDAGLQVPIAVPTRDGREYVSISVPAANEQRHAGLTRWIEGAPLGDVLRSDEDPQRTEHYFEQLGAIAAAIHNQSSNWAQPAGFKRHALNADGLVGDAPFWGPFWNLPNLSKSEKALLLATRNRLRAVLEDYGEHPGTYSLIHADLHLGNLLVHDDRLHVIDFDDAGFGWHLYELAVALFSYQSAPDFDGLQAALVHGYRERRDLDDSALALIPMFLLIRGLAILGWTHQRPELDRGEFLADHIASVCRQCEAFEPP